VYWTWNKVFDDLMAFVGPAAPEIGHFHFPNESFVPLTGKLTRSWDMTILITPAYLRDGVKIRLSKIEGGVEKTLGIFDDQEQCEVWALQKGTEVTFNIEGDIK